MSMYRLCIYLLKDKLNILIQGSNSICFQFIVDMGLEIAYTKVAPLLLYRQLDGRQPKCYNISSPVLRGR